MDIRLQLFSPLSRVCTNSSSWTEKILSLEGLPDCIWQNMRRLSDDFTKSQSKSGGFSFEFLLDSARGISQRTEMMKFLRNAALLCLTAFPRNHILEEAALLTEELFVTKMNSSSCSSAPCQSLAKRLLKCDRSTGIFFFNLFYLSKGTSMCICLADLFIIIKCMICFVDYEPSEYFG